MDRVDIGHRVLTELAREPRATDDDGDGAGPILRLEGGADESDNAQQRHQTRDYDGSHGRHRKAKQKDTENYVGGTRRKTTLLL